MNNSKEVCYLVHFDAPISDSHTTQHYLGTSTDLDKRLQKHANRPDARLMQVAKMKGIGFELVRTWDGGRQKELQLKALKNGKKLCPICNPPKVK